MDEKKALTAIADAPFESLVAKTLFENGWSVEKRILDIRDLQESHNYLRVISLDVEGMTQELLDELVADSIESIFFGPNPLNFSIKEGLLHQPTQNHLALLSILRGNTRAPLIHKSTTFRERKSAELIVIASSFPRVGGSFLAAQCALEISQAQRKVLLIDGDIDNPTAYFHLGVRDISEPQALTPFLSAVDLSTRAKSDHLSSMDEWIGNYDVIILDLGVLGDLSTLERDRRHRGQMITWALDRSKKRVVVTSSGELELRSHSKALIDLKKFKPHARHLEVMNKVERMSKAPENCFFLPRDDRAVAKCSKEKLLLSEGAPRSPLTKSIAQFVREGLM